MSVIRVENLSKTFRTYRSEWHRVLSWFGVAIAPQEEKHILNDINFTIEAGETVGIIGQNGAGKSTLLKILAGTMQPNSGAVHMNGRLAALLELGMGFNPDLPGRLNVMNTAGLMGFSQEQIEEVMPDIEEFAEIGSYFDEPLRTYSSGMQVRLAFSVATAFRPEILIVDEALSVGDAYFQHKSYSRIREFCAAGTTLLLVSHDRSAIASLCSRAILINEGKIRKDGAPEEVLDYYNAIVAKKEGYEVKQIAGADGRIQTVSGTGEAVIENVRLLNENSQEVDTLKVGEPTVLEIDVRIVSAVPELAVGYMIKDRLGQPIFGTNTYHLEHLLHDLKPGDTKRYRFKFDANLGIGNYSIAVSLHQGDVHVTHNYEWRDFAFTFTVINASHAKFVGTAWVPSTLEIS